MSADEKLNVDWNVFAKRYAKDYDTRPFYFTQASADQKVRIAIWTPIPSKTWEIVEHLVSSYPDRVSVLFKVEAEDEKEPWDRYHAADLDKARVLAVVHEHENYVLGDGSNEFMIKRTDTDDYVAYDRHGILWIYPSDSGSQVCEHL